ncbi:MAG: DUF1492 domain-containing protein [Eubacterium sp.]|jgi:hypothetical protein|nr:DUF1492 domain-containing protein [Eubacterium sp.]
MNAKEFFQQAFRLNELIETNRLELKRLRALSQSVSTPSLTGDRIGAGNPDDRVGNIVAKIVDLESEINDEISGFIELEREIRGYICAVSNVNYRLILQKRYINFQKWEEISDEMNYSLRRVLQLHGKALGEASEKYRQR